MELNKLPETLERYGSYFHMGYGMFSFWFNDLWLISQWIVMETCRIPYKNACRTEIRNLYYLLTFKHLYPQRFVCKYVISQKVM